MASREYDRIIAKLAGIFLLAFIIFSLGIGVAQLDSFKRAQNYIASGESEAELLPYAGDPLDKQITILKSSAHALHGGAILIGAEFSKNIAALLIDEQGKVLHRWTAENRLYNPEIRDWWKDLTLNEGFAIEDAHLFPNGDLVFVQELRDENCYRGQRLARMDRDSHILWQQPGNFHHFIDIAEGKIYALRSDLKEGFPDSVAKPDSRIRYLDDHLVAYTLDGKKAADWSILNAFLHSPYSNWLSSFEISVPIAQRILMPDGRVLYDLLHPNSVQYLDAGKAKALPQAKEGDVLLSFRALSALAVFRPSTEAIIWAGRGPFRHQHDAQVEDDGKLYIYDNEGRQKVTEPWDGSAPEEYLSRVARFNPFNNQLTEIYASREMHSSYLGNYKAFDDGSWLMSSPKRARVIVISPGKEILWQMRTIPDKDRFYVPHLKQISFMHYYPAPTLGFLAGKTTELK